MIRSFLTLLLFLPSAFSQSRRKATRRLNPAVSTKSSKKEPVIQQIDLVGSDEFVDISQGLAPLFLLDLISCVGDVGIDCTDYSDLEGLDIPLPVSIAGTLWTDSGDVAGGDPADYWYTLDCQLLEENVAEILAQFALATPELLELPGKSSCNVDVCLGKDDNGDANCVFLRYVGEMNAVLDVGELLDNSKLSMDIDSFKATVIGGTGCYAASIGEALVNFNSFFTEGSIELRTIPSDALEGLWQD